MSNVELKLSRPIQAHGAQVSALTFRPMTARDLRQCGLPLATSNRKTEVNTEAASSLISALAAIPPSSVDQMAPGDYMAAIGVVTDFFTAPTAPT